MYTVKVLILSIPKIPQFCDQNMILHLVFMSKGSFIFCVSKLKSNVIYNKLTFTLEAEIG